MEAFCSVKSPYFILQPSQIGPQIELLGTPYLYCRILNITIHHITIPVLVYHDR